MGKTHGYDNGLAYIKPRKIQYDRIIQSLLMYFCTVQEKKRDAIDF